MCFISAQSTFPLKFCKGSRFWLLCPPRRCVAAAVALLCGEHVHAASVSSSLLCKHADGFVEIEKRGGRDAESYMAGSVSHSYGCLLRVQGWSGLCSLRLCPGNGLVKQRNTKRDGFNSVLVLRVSLSLGTTSARIGLIFSTGFVVFLLKQRR